MNEIHALLDSLAAAAAKSGFETLPYGRVGDFQLTAFQRLSSTPSAPRIYLSSGVHGDEPAGPATLLHLLENNFFSDYDASFFLAPVVNPLGLLAGTRENPAGADLNRDFRHATQAETRALVDLLNTLPPFELSACLHEDWESSGFYLYCLGAQPALDTAKSVIANIAAKHPIDLSELIDESESSGGVIHRSEPLDIDAREDWPEAFYLVSSLRHPHYTLEAPSSFPMEKRIAMLAIAVRTLVDAAFTTPLLSPINKE